jgi:hypothetical protein
VELLQLTRIVLRVSVPTLPLVTCFQESTPLIESRKGSRMSDLVSQYTAFSGVFPGILFETNTQPFLVVF